MARSVRFIILAVDLVVFFLYTKICNIFILNLLKVGCLRVSTAVMKQKKLELFTALHLSLREVRVETDAAVLLSLPSHSIQDHHQPTVGLSSHTTQQSGKGTAGQSEV